VQQTSAEVQCNRAVALRQITEHEHQSASRQRQLRSTSPTPLCTPLASTTSVCRRRTVLQIARAIRTALAMDTLRLRPTATGLDKLPAWFLRLAAPIFCGPIADVINMSLLTSTVPTQWKQAYIPPVPNTPAPKLPADYRTISITPVLTIHDRENRSPTIHLPDTIVASTCTAVQRPDRFPTDRLDHCTIAHLLTTVINLLSTESFVIVISLGFSKAFDTVRHLQLLQKESLAVADKPARREMPKIAPIRRAYNVVADNTGLFSFV